MSDSCLRVIVNAIYWRIHFDRLLVPVEAIRNVKSSIRESAGNCSGRVSGANSRRVISIFHALLAAKRIGHLDPAICSRLARREIGWAVRSLKRVDEVRPVGRVCKCRLNSNLVSDRCQLMIGIVGEGGVACGRKRLCYLRNL